MKRVYGRVWLKGGLWHIEGEPHLIVKIKRYFPRIWAGQHAVVTLKDSDEMRREIDWILDRHELKVSHKDRLVLEEGAKRHKDKIITLDRLLGRRRVSRAYRMAIPPRDYQKIAGEMALENGYLLLADELGSGKTVSAFCVLTEKAALPAVVVTLANTMPMQWERMLKAFMPDIFVHVINRRSPVDKKGELYEIPERDGRRPDVYILTYHKLSGWTETLALYAKAVIFDEMQELRRRASEKYSAAEHIARKARFRMGLSVGPDSMILVEDDSGIRHLRIDEFAESMGAIEDIFVPVEGVKVRSFDGNNFCWKPLKAVLKHKAAGKRTFRIRTEKGRSLLFTEDHSIYRVIENGFIQKNQSKKPVLGLELVRGTDLREGDHILLEDSFSENRTIDKIDIVDYITASRWYVNGDFGDWIDTNITVANGIKGASFVRHRQKVVGHRGTYVTGAQFIADPELRARGGRIYTQGKGGIWTSPTFPTEDISYVLGFFLGDGWVSDSRICFAVENRRLRGFLKKIAPMLQWTRSNLSVRVMSGGSVEVRFSNLILSNFFTGFFRNARAWEKQIPDEVFSFSQKDTRRFIQGMLDSDGSFSLRGTKKMWYYATTSSELAAGLVELLKKVGVVAGVSQSNIIGSGGTVKGRKIRSRRPKYQVYFSHYEWTGDNSGKRGRRQRFESGNIAGYPVRIKEIREEPESMVYDLSVDSEHWQSFVASGILVHNSATPIYNLGGEIWNLVNILQEDALGTDEEFKREWCHGERDRRKAPAVRDPKALGSYLRAEHIMLRRTRKELGRELPPLTKIPQYVESDEAAIDQIKDSAAELARIILSSEKTAGWDRLKAHEEFDQILRQATGVAKAPYVADFVRLLVEGEDEPVIVLAWHRAVYDILLAKLKDLRPVMFTGSETPAAKQTSLSKFMARETRVMLMSLRAGQGVDGLQKVCRTVVFAELDWSPGVMDQCIGRVFRDGQTDPVTAFFCVTERGSDPTVAETLGLKTAQVEGLRDPEGALLEELQTDAGRIRRLAEKYLEKARKRAAAPSAAAESPAGLSGGAADAC